VSPFFITNDNEKELRMANVKSVKSIFGISKLPVSRPFLVSSDKPLYTAPPLGVLIRDIGDKFVAGKAIKK